MIETINELSLDYKSFWIGFLAGFLFLLLFIFIRKHLPTLVHLTRQTAKKLIEKLSESDDARFRNEIILYTQKQHLAAMLFSLDEIAVEPRLIAPPPQRSRHSSIPSIDVVTKLIPYIPDWPEMTTVFQASTLSIIDVLQVNSRIALLGYPGSGKTFALAWLATRIGRKEPMVGSLAKYLPVYIHAADIRQKVQDSTPIGNGTIDSSSPVFTAEDVSDTMFISSLQILSSILTDYRCNLKPKRLQKILAQHLKENRIVLLVDGLDELVSSEIKTVVEFLNQILSQFPEIKIVTAMSLEDFDGIVKAGFVPLSLVAWGRDTKKKFISKWDTLWTRLIEQNSNNSVDNIDKKILENWLLTDGSVASPFEFTLRTWTAYSGDQIGGSHLDLLDTYIKLLSMGINGARITLEVLAYHLIKDQNFRAGVHDAGHWISEHKRMANSSPGGNDSASELIKERDLTTSRSRLPLNRIINSSLITSLPGDRFTLSHPILIGYLAGSALTSSTGLNEILTQPSWLGKSLTLKYYAHYCKSFDYIVDTLEHNDILNTELLSIARWLPIAPKNSTWYQLVLRNLVKALLETPASSPLGAKLATAIALSGDPGIGIFFKQLIKSDKPHLQILGVLGCGLIHDGKAIEDLVVVLNGTRSALYLPACLALAEINTKQTLDLLLSTLQKGSATCRRAAAEALANHSATGHLLLRDACLSSDLLTRRAIVYGLARLQEESWAIECLKKMEMEDDEWIVRNSAGQVLEERQQPNPNIPHPIPPLTEIPWLVEFAGKLGQGVPAGEEGMSLVLQALNDGTTEEKLLALEHLTQNLDPDALKYIVELYHSKTDELQTASYYALWLMSISGNNLATA